MRYIFNPITEQLEAPDNPSPMYDNLGKKFKLAESVLPYDFDDLTPKEEQYYQQNQFSTHPEFLAAEGGLARKGFLYGSDDVKKVKELRKKGRTSDDIGKFFKKSGSWVEQIVRKHKLPKQTIPLGGFSKGFIRGAAERPSKWLIDYSRADLAKDLKAGKTLNEISEDLYAKHKFDYDKIPVRQQGKYKTTPVAHILSSLNSKIETKTTEGWNKEVLKENKALRNLADQNQAKYNRTVKNIKTDINNFISSNKAKYKKLYQTDTVAPKKFYKAILDMVEKKYPKFIKVSEGAVYGGITKEKKFFLFFRMQREANTGIN